jgi:hypothetical protein
MINYISEEDLSYLFEFQTTFSNYFFKLKSINSFTQLNIAKKITISKLSDYLSCVDFWDFLKKVLNLSTSPDSREDLNKINVIDGISLLVKLRCISYGNELKLIVTKSNSSLSESEREQLLKNPKSSVNKINLNLDLDMIIDGWVSHVKSVLEKNNHIQEGNFEVKIKLPDFKETPFINFNCENLNTEMDSYLHLYIDKLSFKEKEFPYCSLTKDRQIQLLQSLPVGIYNKIKNTVFLINEQISSYNFYRVKVLEEDRIHFLNGSMPEFLGLIYTEKINNLYKEFYILGKKNIHPGFIEKISPLERHMFLGFIEEENTLKNNIINEGSEENNAASLFQSPESSNFVPTLDDFQ